MLVSLHAKNFAIIDEIEVNFGDKLNIISGETGAGKSVIIGSVNAALGGKMTREMIRGESEFALVELVFETKREAVAELLREHDVPLDNSEIVISRKLYSNGRNVVRVNGETVTVTFVKELAGLLIDIHGQHEHQSFLKKAEHLRVLDRFIGNDIEEKKSVLKKEVAEYRKWKEEQENAVQDEDARARELSFLQYAVNEIDAAKLVDGEEEELFAEFRKLSSANTIQEVLAEVNGITESGNSSVADQVGYAIRQLSKITEYDDSLSDLSDMLVQMEDCIHDFNRSLRDYLEQMDDAKERFLYVEERLELIHRLEAKYGNTIRTILDYAEECREKVEKLEDYDRYLERLSKNFAMSERKVNELCTEISCLRKENASLMCDRLKEALEDLNFLDVKIEMEIKRTDQYTENGFDDAEFLISTNPGEPVMPLAKIASGGELSRIMLALKSVFAGKDDIETMIFDEIDTGISGRTAQKVSEKMALLASGHQLLCITHLSQIAAMADTHFVIEKETDGIHTRTGIYELDEFGQQKEIARMLGGVEVTDTVLESAKEMKLLACKKKEKFGR